MRDQCSGKPWLHSQRQWQEGAESLQDLTLQQVGHEQRCTLVTAGQPPLGQVLLDLESEEVPVERDRSTVWGELGAGLSHEGRACSHVSSHGLQEEHAALQKAAAGHHHDQHVPVIEMLISRFQN